MLHRVPVRGRSHHDADQRFGHLGELPPGWSGGKCRRGGTPRCAVASRSPSSAAISTRSSTSSWVVRKFTKHGRSQTSSSIRALDIHTRPSAWSARQDAGCGRRRPPRLTARDGTPRSTASAGRAPRSRRAADTVSYRSSASRQVALDRLGERRGPVRAHREPELQRPERPRVLERRVHRVELVALVRQVPLLVPERRHQVLLLAHQQDPARLRQVEPLVGVDGDRVRALEPLNSSGRVATAGSPYAPSTWNQTSALLADVGDRLERVDRAGERRTRRRDDRDRRDAVGQVPVDRLGQRLGDQAAIGTERDRAEVRGAHAERLDGPRDRVVHLVRAVDRDALAPRPS